ncbi:hypothetical protein HOP50_15g76350 [Chloropicon primus]|nr:hypothetical protein HOP50_15g76350 [Chloropicon primus]
MQRKGERGTREEDAVKNFSRKIAKAVLSPREDLDDTLAMASGSQEDGAGGDSGEEVDVYEVVDRYKQELEDIISTLAPSMRAKRGGSGGVKKAWGEETEGGVSLVGSKGKKSPTKSSGHGDTDNVDEKELRRYQRSLLEDQRRGGGGLEEEEEVGQRVFDTVSNFSKDVANFKERVGRGQGQGPPTVEANLTEDFFFEMPGQEGHDHDHDRRHNHNEEEEEEEEEDHTDEVGELDREDRRMSEIEGMEGFGAAGSAELASRSYGKVGRDRNGHSIHPGHHANGRRGDYGGDHDRLEMDEGGHQASFMQEFSGQNGQVSVNAVELDAIQQELRELREWKQTAEESISRLHHQLAMSQQAVFDLTEKMGLVIEEQKSVRSELQYRSHAASKAHPVRRESEEYHHHSSLEDTEEKMDMMPSRDGRTLRKSRGASSLGRRERERGAPADHGYEQTHAFKHPKASSLDPGQDLHKYIEEVKAKVASEPQAQLSSKAKAGLPTRKEGGGRKAKTKLRSKHGQASSSSGSQLAASASGAGKLKSVIIDRVPKSLEVALEAVHALRPFDGGMSAPSSQLQGPLDMGDMSDMEDHSEVSSMSEESDVVMEQERLADEKREMELNRQWSLEHYLGPGAGPRKFHSMECERQAEHHQHEYEDRGGVDGGGGVDATSGAHAPQVIPPKPKDYWLEEMLGAIDQEFHSLREEQSHEGSYELSSPSRGGKKRSGGLLRKSKASPSSKMQVKAKVDTGLVGLKKKPKAKAGASSKKKLTFAESLGDWKTGLRGARHDGSERPKSAKPKKRVAKAKKRPATASRYMKTT